MPESFFVANESSGFHATEATRGPWDVEHQHAGPPSGLLGRALESFEPREGARIVKVAIDILRPVPIGDLEIDVRIARPGKRIELLEAVARSGEDELLKARAWRMRTESSRLPEVSSGIAPLPGPETGRWEPFFEMAADVGYHTHMDCGSFAEAFEKWGPRPHGSR
jgi:Acyl-CoA thioesterase N-terminal domain